MALLCENLMCDVSILALVITTAILFWKHRSTYWKRHGIPQIDPTFPFGNLKNMILRTEHIGETFKKLYFELKARKVPFGGYYNTVKPELLIVDPEYIKFVLIKDFQHFMDRASFSDEKNDPLTGHLFALKGQKWRNLRTKLSPTFTSGKMKMMFQTLVATSDELNNILEAVSKTGEPIDIKDVLGRFTTDVIGSCAFGLECNSLKDPDCDFRVYGKQVFQFTTKRFFLRIIGFVYPKILKFLKIPLVDRKVSEFYIGLVRNIVKYREENDVFRKDFLQLLLELRRKGYLSDDDGSDVESPTERYIGDGKTLTIEEMAAQCFVFFIAGFETSSTTMSFALYELTQNPDIQEKVRREIVQVLEKHGGMTYNAIMEMQYLDKVVSETLRKYPVVAALSRNCTKDYKLPGTNYTMKVGDSIRISVQGIHEDPEYYPNPEVFDPERFSEEEKAKRPHCTYLPFGDGPRICIGMRFGLMQTKVGLAVLLKNYRFTLNNKTEFPMKINPKIVVLGVKGNIWLNAQKIDSS